MEEVVLDAITKVLSNLSVRAVNDAYQSLKSKLKTEGSPEVSEALSRLEQNPDSEQSQEDFKRALQAHGPDQDWLIDFAQEMSEHESSVGQQPSIQQTVEGDSNVVSGSGSIVIVKSR